VTVAHEPGNGQLWLTDICQQEIIVRDSANSAVLFRQPSHALLSPGSCVVFWEMGSGVTGFDLVEDNGEWGSLGRAPCAGCLRRVLGGPPGRGMVCCWEGLPVV
jgi:hypothetical protein